MDSFEEAADSIIDKMDVLLRRAKRRKAAEAKPDVAAKVADVPVYPKGLSIHAASFCAGETCVFHAPSVHHMRGWPINVRLDRFGALAERLCPHGVGHPDPDSLAYVESLHTESERGYEGVHGCDGCCRP